MIRACLALLLCLPFAPTPELAPTGGGNRGQAELRDPATSTANLSYLMRDCLRCHKHGGPNTTMFDAERRLLPGLPREYLRRYIPLALRAEQYAPRTEAERADLRRALQELQD